MVFRNLRNKVHNVCESVYTWNYVRNNMGLNHPNTLCKIFRS